MVERGVTEESARSDGAALAHCRSNSRVGRYRHASSECSPMYRNGVKYISDLVANIRHCTF